jgi:hypothetical protein
MSRTTTTAIAVAVAALAAGVAAGWFLRARTHPGAATASPRECVPTVIVALEPTAVPLGVRQMVPVFPHGSGGRFEAQVRVTAFAAPGSFDPPNAESSFELVVRAPGGNKRFLDRRGRIARGVTGVRATDAVPESAVPPLAPTEELVATFVYDAPAEAATLEVEVAPATGARVTRATAEVRVYELGACAAAS